VIKKTVPPATRASIPSLAARAATAAALLAAAIALVMLLAACAAPQADKGGTLGSLRGVRADTSEAPVTQGLDKAMDSYAQFLQKNPDSKLTPEAMRRLADLKIEKEYGIQGDGKIIDVAPAKPTAPPRQAPPVAPRRAAGASRDSLRGAPVAPQKIDTRAADRTRRAAIQPALPADSERDLEKRAMAQQALPGVVQPPSLDLPEGVNHDLDRAGPLEAIKLYDELLAK